VRRISDITELRRLLGRSGYVLNVSGSVAHIHRADCVTVRWMNPVKRRRVFFASSLEEIWEWIEGESVEASPCRLCLPALSYRPRPEKLTDHL